MVTKNVTFDGHQYRDFNTSTKVLGADTTGTWETVSSINSGTSGRPNTVWAGYFGGRRFNPTFRFNAVEIDPNASIASATLNLPVDIISKNVMINIKAYKDETTPSPSPTYLPDSQVLGAQVVFFNTSTDANATDGSWTPATNPFTFDITAILQEVVNDPSWANPGDLVIVVRTADYEALSGFNSGDNDGYIAFWSKERPTGTPAQLIYTLTAAAAPTITNVDGDNSILADQSNIIITGTNLTNANALRIFDANNSYPQTINSVSATQVIFNAAGNIPSGSTYTLELTVDTATVTRTIQVVNESEVVENVTEGVALTAIDGHEYGASFPGTWETKASLASTAAWTDGVIVGLWNSNKFKASFKVGPIVAENSANVFSAELVLNIITNYKINDLRIKAVANPDAADIGAANLISSQTLTTAEVSVNNTNWVGSDPFSYWIQAVNPKNIDVTAIMQEVVNHVNWSTGDYIQFVVDYADLGGGQGMTRIFTNDDNGLNPAKLNYSIDQGSSITSVSSDNKIELGEENVAIVGRKLTGATNLNINKGAISENQTIKSSTDTSIIFDVTTGAIVPDTGYTLQFDVSGTTYSTTVEFVTGGGVNSGSINQSYDGHEDTVTNTWSAYYATGNVCFIGISPFVPAATYTAHATLANISAQRGQTFTTANLTWASTWANSAYKILTFRIYAVADPTVAALSASSLPSAATLTTNFVTVDTNTWAGSSSFSYWIPGAEVIDITTVVEEVVANANWTTGSSIQLVFVPQTYPAGNANVSFQATEGAGSLLTFDYATASATNVANVNGDNVVRVGGTDIVITGSDLDSASALSITDGTYTTVQTIKTNTATEITFDFVQGQLGYTANATLTVTKGGINYTFNCALEPALQRQYVVLSTPSTGDNSLTYNDSPALVSGDIIDYNQFSNNGFVVNITAAGVPQILGGSSVDTFTARAYVASTGTWYDYQTITFEQASYFVRAQTPLLEFGLGFGSGTTQASDESEVWTTQTDADDFETWTTI